MKNKKNLIGLIAILAIIVFTFAACQKNTTHTCTAGTPIIIAPTCTVDGRTEIRCSDTSCNALLSTNIVSALGHTTPVCIRNGHIFVENAQLYDWGGVSEICETLTFDYDWVSYWNEHFPLSEKFSDYVASVSAGKLNLNFGVPKSEKLLPLKAASGYDMGDSVIGSNAETVKGFFLFSLFSLFDFPVYYYLSLAHNNAWVIFVYVDQVVTINGTAGTARSGTFNNVTLQPGWNTLHVSSTFTFTNITVNSSYRWITGLD